MRTPIHVFYFKSGHNQCKISAESLHCIGDKQKNKTRFGILSCNPSGDFPLFFVTVRTVTPHLYSRFYPGPFRFGEI